MTRRIRRTSLLITVLVSTSILAGNPPPRAWVGFGFTHHASNSEKPGWLHVLRVAADGPAQRAGIRVHDIITAIDGKPIAFANDVAALDHFAKVKVGAKLRLRVTRREGQRDIVLMTVPLPEQRRKQWDRNYEHAREEQ